ncbi:AAA family ATPase [Enterocloster lavalensis]|uniref:AAA family ATPase n=1 Tax=Enterocloster lavalensis TaxID=460384 RepID=UPI001D09790B|nr:ATP-binding protein [Enterocloster lavalensis]
MLVQYAVSNYKSIKDEIIINFARIDDERDDNWTIPVEEPRCRLYNVIGLMGPNASGKSNIIDSFYFAIRFIKNTISRKEKSKIKVEPFLLDDQTQKQPSSFEFIYIYQGIKYVYGFSVNSVRVEEEYLLAYYSAKPTTVFERQNGAEYHFRGNDVSRQRELSGKTNANRLYLPVAAEWGYDKLSCAYAWFENVFDQYENVRISDVLETIVVDEKKKSILLESLQKADFNITDIYVKKRKLEKQQIDVIREIIAKIVPEVEVDNVPESNPEIYVTHRNKGENEYSINLNDDSSGTKSIVFDIAELLYLSQGGLILEDELGRNYHTRLTEYYLKLIGRLAPDHHRVQMLFASHDTKILNLLNRDQIYLVDKNEEGATFLKLLDDYIIREKDNIELGYLKGRYGAIPYMRE